jgi:hypothetical protein
VLWERSVTEQRYNAVIEVLEAGLPVTEVADRYGVSRGRVWSTGVRGCPRHRDGPGSASRSQLLHLLGLLVAIGDGDAGLGRRSALM